MSFYGQALYEFTKIFHRIGVKNSGFDSQDILPEEAAAAGTFIADERWDQVNFDTGNRWIHLEATNGASGNTMTISHSAPGNTSQTSAGFASVENATDANELRPGQLFTTSIANFDAAGHLTGDIETVAYKLPPSIIQIEDGDQVQSDDEDGMLHFKGDNLILLNKDESAEILQFSHALSELEHKESQGFVRLEELPEDIKAIELNTGDYFTTNKIYFQDFLKIKCTQTVCILIFSTNNRYK